jgi:hypothetical protein
MSDINKTPSCGHEERPRPLEPYLAIFDENVYEWWDAIVWADSNLSAWDVFRASSIAKEHGVRATTLYSQWQLRQIIEWMDGTPEKDRHGLGVIEWPHEVWAAPNPPDVGCPGCGVRLNAAYANASVWLLCVRCDAVVPCLNCANYSADGAHWKCRHEHGIVECSACGADRKDRCFNLNKALAKHGRSVLISAPIFPSGREELPPPPPVDRKSPAAIKERLRKLDEIEQDEIEEDEDGAGAVYDEDAIYIKFITPYLAVRGLHPEDLPAFCPRCHQRPDHRDHPEFIDVPGWLPTDDEDGLQCGPCGFILPWSKLTKTEL